MQLVIEGDPFDAGAVRHAARHVAMRAGWRLVAESRYRMVYTTLDREPGAADPPPVVIRSGPDVARHLREARTPVPLERDGGGGWMPFPARRPRRPGEVAGDVLAAALAWTNLWYEGRLRPAADDGWIRWDEDWMAGAGLAEPAPLADDALERVRAASREIGWPEHARRERATIVLTHDVDYLPGRWDRGLPRLARAVYRHVALRRRPADALNVFGGYVAASLGSVPYDELGRIVREERARDARSSFQFVVAREHPADPGYASRRVPASALPPEWEVCLHGSYRACREPGRLRRERARLEASSGRTVSGHRQHYLNFEPAVLFHEVEQAGLRYDMSIGYNDRSGPRAATHHPYRPWDLVAGRPHAFWEIPFVLMDTTLATTHRLGPGDALAHARDVLAPVVASGGCVSIIWHQEECGGLLDPGYDRVYLALLDWLRDAGARLVNGATVVAELDAAWEATADAA